MEKTYGAPVVALANASRSIIEGLTKLRTADDMINAVARDAIEVYCQRSAEPYGQALQAIRSEIARLPGAQPVVDRIDVMIKRLIGDLNRAGQDALAETLQRFDVSL